MPEVELYPHIPHQHITNVVVSTNSNSDPEITTEFEHNFVPNFVHIDGVFGFDEINGNFLEIEAVDGTRFTLYDWGSSTQTYIGGGIARVSSKYYNKNSNNSGIKPTFVGTNLYFPIVASLQQSTSGTDISQRLMYQMQSTDTGTTWTVLDSANSPPHFGNWTWTVLQTDTKLWYVLETTGTSSGRSWDRFRMTDFDITAGTWGALDTSGLVPFGESPDNVYSELHPISSDRLVWYYVHASLRANSSTVGFEKPGLAIFDASSRTWVSVNNIATRETAALSGATIGSPGTFTASSSHFLETGDLVTVSISGMNGTNTQTQRVTVINSTVFTLGTDVTGTFASGTYSHDYEVFPCWAIPSAVSNGIHLFYGKNQTGTGSAGFSTLYHKHVTVGTGNSLTYGDESVVSDKTTLRTLPLGPGCSYVSGTNTKIEFPLAVSTSTATSGSISIDDMILGISFISEENPTFSTETIISVQADVPAANSEGPWGCYGYNPTNNKIYFVYELDDPDHPESKTDLWIRSKTVGGSWGTATLWKTDSEYFYGHPSVYASDTRVHVIYSKLHPDDLSPSESPFTDLHDFPHYDVLEVCPVAGSGGGNYAYLS